MHYGSVPGVEKPISRLAQGTAAGFDSGNQDAAFALLDMALAHGYNTFDTAHVYGARTSQMFGKWIRERGVRDRIVILAKGAHHGPQGGRVTPEDLTSDLNDALNWMEVDSVDLYVLHRDDPSVPVGPIVEALNTHHKAGRIGAFGGSNWSYERIKEANEYARAHGLMPLAVSSPNFSLAEQVEEPWTNCVSISGPQGEAARQWYAQSDVALFTWSSLAAGFFSDRFHRDNLDQFTGHDALTVRCYAYEQNFQRLDRARELARQKEISVPQIALAFVMSQPLNIFALVFCANEQQFAANAAALDVKLTPQEIAYLDLKADAPA